jgi:hypothetical protein
VGEWARRGDDYDFVILVLHLLIFLAFTFGVDVGYNVGWLVGWLGLSS